MRKELFLAALFAGTALASALGIVGVADVLQDDAGPIILAQGTGTPVGPDLRGPRDREPGGEGNARPDTGDRGEGRGPPDTVHPDLPRGDVSPGKGDDAHLNEPAIILGQPLPPEPVGISVAPATESQAAKATAVLIPATAMAAKAGDRLILYTQTSHVAKARLTRAKSRHRWREPKGSS
ncbi:hypothetical protein [Sinorhizobium fredii]|nr:hypothetical protein [Sinorhizobium fredii]